MNFFLKQFAVLTLLSLGFFCQTAFADNRPGAFVVSPGVGAYLFNPDRNLKNNPMYNLGLGYDFNCNWGIEALAGTVPTSIKSNVFLGSQSVRANFYSIDGIYHLSTNIPLVPYVLAGAGMLDFNSNQPQLDNQANLNAGAGLEYFLNNSFAIKSDVRDIYSVSSGRSDMLVNFGVSFLLGGHSPSSIQSVAVSSVNTCVNNRVMVRFAPKSSDVDAIYKSKLQHVISCLQDNPGLHLNIDGYAKSLNNSKLDLQLSQQRAINVRNYLEQAGIEPIRITAQGFGNISSAAGSAETNQMESVVVSLSGKRS